MQPDDVLPNDGSYFSLTEPSEQVIERKQKKAHTLEALPVLQEMLARLDQQVEYLGSVDAMPAELKTQPTKFMNYHNANELARNILRAEQEYLEGLIIDYAPKR